MRLIKKLEYRLNDCKEILQQAAVMFKAYGSSTVWLNAIRGCFWILLDITNKEITGWEVNIGRTGVKGRDKKRGIPIWYGSIYPMYMGPIGDPPEPAHDQILIAENWLVPGYNVEQIY